MPQAVRPVPEGHQRVVPYLALTPEEIGRRARTFFASLTPGRS